MPMPRHLRPAARRGRRAARACIAAAVLSLPAGVVAQGAAGAVVSGTVVDSLTGRPLADATVQLVPRPGAAAAPVTRGAVSDSAGAFRIENAPAGAYLLGFLHPRLDQLGITPPVRAVDVPAAGAALRVDLAVPGPRTLAAAICGAPAGRASPAGVLIGRVRDADDGHPVAAGAVTVRWDEIRVDAGGLRHEHRALRATADDEGRFAVCGVPTDGPVLAHAAATGSGNAASGDVELQVPAGPARAFLERDLLVAGRAVARVAGHVRRPDGRPVAGARVLVDRDTALTATTDAAGRFAFDALAAGTRTLEARAIGFSPRRVAVDLAGGGLTTADVTFARPVAALDAVTVYGRTSRDGVSGFLRRSRGGFGRFLFAEQIARTPASSATDLLRMTPGLRVEPAGDGVHSVLYSRGALNLTQRCRPDVFINGTLVQGGASDLDDLVNPREVAGIEVYTDFASAPVEYQRGPCGSVVVWTRGAL